VDVLVRLEPSASLMKRLVMLKVLPLSLRNGPANSTVAGPGVPGKFEGLTSLESSIRTKLLVVVKVLGLDWINGVVPVPTNFPLSETAMKFAMSKVLPLAIRRGPPSVTVVGVSGLRERRMVRKFPDSVVPMADTLLLLRLKRAGASPTEGFGGPVRVALSPMKKNVLRTVESPVAMLVLSVALKSGPKSVNEGGIWSIRLDRTKELAPVFTVLPLS
jgi:hypothetical protein